MKNLLDTLYLSPQVKRLWRFFISHSSAKTSFKPPEKTQENYNKLHYPQENRNLFPAHRNFAPRFDNNVVNFDTLVEPSLTKPMLQKTVSANCYCI